MDKIVGMAEARNRLGEIVDQVQSQGNTFIVSRNGKPTAAIVPLQVYEAWKEQRKAFFEAVREMQKQANLNLEEAKHLADEAVQYVRKSM